jgi:cobalt-zinc-cadmium efflux system outer membrane protein
MGLPGMPPTELAGRIDLPIPVYQYDRVLARVLANHTDVLTTRNTIDKAQFNLRLAEITPYPDLSVSANIYNDVTPPGHNRLVTSVNVSVPVPLFDRNQGAIRQAQGALMRAKEEPHRVRDDLTARVADAFRRYDENKVLLELYVREALPKQVQAFRAAVKRHYGAEPDKVAYTDLVSAEQNLVGLVGTYLTVLGAQWQAVVDVASLLQTDDVFQSTEQFHVAGVPDLEHLLDLPCCHPCSTVTDPGQRFADWHWPPAGIAPAVPPAQPGPPTKGMAGTPAPALLPAPSPSAEVIQREQIPSSPPLVVPGHREQRADP